MLQYYHVKLLLKGKTADDSYRIGTDGECSQQSVHNM